MRGEAVNCCLAMDGNLPGPFRPVPLIIVKADQVGLTWERQARRSGHVDSGEFFADYILPGGTSRSNIKLEMIILL